MINEHTYRSWAKRPLISFRLIGESIFQLSLIDFHQPSNSPCSSENIFRIKSRNHSLVKPPISSPGSPTKVTFNFFFKSLCFRAIWREKYLWLIDSWNDGNLSQRNTSCRESLTKCDLLTFKFKKNTSISGICWYIARFRRLFWRIKVWVSSEYSSIGWKLIYSLWRSQSSVVQSLSGKLFSSQRCSEWMEIGNKKIFRKQKANS